jgi:hypothetical protein
MMISSMILSWVFFNTKADSWYIFKFKHFEFVYYYLNVTKPILSFQYTQIIVDSYAV